MREFSVALLFPAPVLLENSIATTRDAVNFRFIIVVDAKLPETKIFLRREISLDCSLVNKRPFCYLIPRRLLCKYKAVSATSTKIDVSS